MGVGKATQRSAGRGGRRRPKGAPARRLRCGGDLAGAYQVLRSVRGVYGGQVVSPLTAENCDGCRAPLGRAAGEMPESRPNEPEVNSRELGATI